jgi:hypothetical protein
MSAFGGKADIGQALSVYDGKDINEARKVSPEAQRPRQITNRERTQQNFLCNFLAERVIFRFLTGKFRREENISRHPHFISGPPAVSTGPDFRFSGRKFE